MLKMFDALPAYFGGKRKLAKKILMYAEGKTFIDGFMGGGSVALLAKARGKRVIANDIAERSAVVADALIVNTDVFIEDEDLARLFTPNPANINFIENHLSRLFRNDLARFLDNARANILALNDPAKRAVLTLLWIKTIIYFRPMGTFTHPNAVEKLEVGEISTPVLQELAERYSRPLYGILSTIAADINSGIFDNGLENEFHKQDVFEFLSSVKGDTIYLDPPYYGAQSYEYFYNALDQMLAGKQFPPEHSEFNKKQVISTTLKLFEACEHIPVWILSVGERVIDKKKYIDLMSDFRTVEDIPVSHAHTFGYGHNEESGAQEVLLVGRPK
jgi:site-specific DNA-adenine methylase